MKSQLAVPLSLLLAACGSEASVEYQEWTDTFAQAANNQVDILWVVDDSASMEQEQSTLAAGFASFASQLEASGTDFQIGMVTTSFDYADPDRGVLIGDPPFLTNADDYERLFRERATQAGTEGSDKEKGLEVATFALHPSMTLPGGPNEGFVRDEAQLLVVFVSDEEDCSDNGALEGQPPTACYTEKDQLVPVQTFVEDLRDLKPTRDQVQVGAIVGTEASTCPEVYPGSRYLQTAALMGGLMGDICEAEWSGMLRDLGLNATGIRTRFQLTYAAQPETLVVYVDDTEATSGWTYDPATWYVVFDDAAVPPRGAMITATYTIDPGVTAPTVGSTTTP